MMHQISADDGKKDEKTLLITQSRDLHKKIHEDIKYFRVKSDIRESSNPIGRINQDIVNKSLFSFSFVRHPYTR